MYFRGSRKTFADYFSPAEHAFTDWATSHTSSLLTGGQGRKRRLSETGDADDGGYLPLSGGFLPPARPPMAADGSAATDAARRSDARGPSRSENDRRVLCEGIPYHKQNLKDLIEARSEERDDLKRLNWEIERQVQGKLKQRAAMLERIRQLSLNAHDRSLASIQINDLRFKIRQLEDEMHDLVSTHEANGRKIEALDREIAGLRQELRRTNMQAIEECGFQEPQAPLRPRNPFGGPGR